MAEVEGLEPTRRLTAHSFPSCCPTIRRYFRKISTEVIILNLYSKVNGMGKYLFVLIIIKCLIMKNIFFYLNIISRTPAATADPITPATLGPIACIRRKLLGFSS